MHAGSAGGRCCGCPEGSRLTCKNKGEVPVIFQISPCESTSRLASTFVPCVLLTVCVWFCIYIPFCDSVYICFGPESVVLNR